MVDDITQASDALRLAAADLNFRPLIPALSSCPTCGALIMVAAPVLTTCRDCGVVAVVLDRTSVAASAAHHRSADTLVAEWKHAARREAAARIHPCELVRRRGGRGRPGQLRGDAPGDLPLRALFFQPRRLVHTGE